MRDHFTDKILARFWKHAPVQDTLDGCWLWRGGTTKDGYGIFHADPEYTTTAHRYIAEAQFSQRIMRVFDASHTCHNRLCVNPRHIVFETRQKNVQRITATNAHRKLTPEQCLAIMARWRQQGHRKGLAKEFGVSRGSIYGLTIGRYYSNITGLSPP